MPLNQVLSILDDFDSALPWLESAGLADRSAGYRRLQSIAKTGVTLDLMDVLLQQLGRLLPHLSDPDQALANLDRFLVSTRSPISLAALFQRDADSLEVLLEIFSSSQYLSDLLVRDPESYDLLRLTDGQPISKVDLEEELKSELGLTTSLRSAGRILRRFKHREILRIAYGDLIRKLPLERTTAQLANLAEVICSSAVELCSAVAVEKFGELRTGGGRLSRLVLFALDGLAGEDIGYSADLQLTGVYEEGGFTDRSPRMSADDYFKRIFEDISILLSEETESGIAYRVIPDREWSHELRLGQAAGRFVSYFDQKGGAWDRIKLVRCRPIAGDLEFGKTILHQLQPWIFPKYLSASDVTELRALRRRFLRPNAATDDVKSIRRAHGGLSDVEYAIQFLQLINGCLDSSVRSAGFFPALDALYDKEILIEREHSILLRNYSRLRRLQHRIQLQSTEATDLLPRGETDARRLLRGLEVSDILESAVEQLDRIVGQLLEENRLILGHLLQDPNDAEDLPAEANLVLHPDLSKSEKVRLVSEFGFDDPENAVRNLNLLAVEKYRFISSRRCRHFLAVLIRPLLQAIAETANPDRTLGNMVRVSDSLGGKGSLWELFQANRSCLNLYVTLCSATPYLASILTSNPGMIDELMDGLMLGQFPDRETMQRELMQTCVKATDIGPVVHGFRNSRHLQIGIRNLVRRDNLAETHRALADVADCCLAAVCEYEFRKLTEKLGKPTACQYEVVVTGKVGAREPNYHSHLAFLLVYECDGQTTHKEISRSCSHQQFFNQLATAISKFVSQPTGWGRLYELDQPLTDISGAPAAYSLGSFAKLAQSRQATLETWLDLTQARPIGRVGQAAQDSIEAKVTAIIRTTIESFRPASDFRASIRNLRELQQRNADPFNLKRFAGGTLDVEYITRAMTLEREAIGESFPSGTLDQLESLSTDGSLDSSDAARLREAYLFLRKVESSLRLMDFSRRHTLPGTIDRAHDDSRHPTAIGRGLPAEDEPFAEVYLEQGNDGQGREDQSNLAMLMGYDRFESLVEDFLGCQAEVRTIFEKLFPPVDVDL